MDARVFLEENQDKGNYDYIIHDVFTTQTTASHLFSYESFVLCRKMLSFSGVLAVNIVGNYVGLFSRSYELVYNTLQTVFPRLMFTFFFKFHIFFF